MSTLDSEGIFSLQPTVTTPLLPSAQREISQLRSSGDWIDRYLLKVHGEDTALFRLRLNLQNFLSSKWGHYFVLGLVSLDIAGIFADFLITMHVCEHGKDKGFDRNAWEQVSSVLGDVSFAFSCLFVAELLGSVFAFGIIYFKSLFSCFDAAVIVAGFVVDILLRGPLEEAGSLVVVLRLWRVFKIIEEFSTEANNEKGGLYEHIDMLREENDNIRKESDNVRDEIETLRKMVYVKARAHDGAS